MAEVGALDQTKLMSESEMTEDQYYGKPELGEKWAEDLKRHEEKKRNREINKGFIERRHKVLRDRYSILRKPTEVERKALQMSGEKISPEEFISYLDPLELDLALKEALVQNYTEYNNMRSYGKIKVKEVNSNDLINQLKENRPSEPLNLPQKVPAKQIEVVAKK